MIRLATDTGPSERAIAAGGAGRLRIELRRRQNDDVDALFRLFDQPLCRFGLIREPFADAAAFASWLRARGSRPLDIVATHEGDPIGFAALHPGSETRSHVGEIAIFVHDLFHGRGVGARLMNALMIAAASLRRLNRLELTVRTENRPALAMYLKFGFDIEGHHRRFARRDGVDIDVFTMAKDMRAGPARH